MFEVGDEVVYNPNMPDLPPPNRRRNDWGMCIHINGQYATVLFLSGYSSDILFQGITHHPLSPKAIRANMRRVLPGIRGAVEGRMGALVFSELTGQTAQQGYGAADVIRSFLDERF